MVTLFSTIFSDVMPPGAFQLVPGWTGALVIKTLTRSSIAVKVVRGAPSSDVVLCNEFDKANTALLNKKKILEITRRS